MSWQNDPILAPSSSSWERDPVAAPPTSAELQQHYDSLGARMERARAEKPSARESLLGFTERMVMPTVAGGIGAGIGTVYGGPPGFTAGMGAGSALGEAANQAFRVGEQKSVMPGVAQDPEWNPLGIAVTGIAPWAVKTVGGAVGRGFNKIADKIRPEREARNWLAGQIGDDYVDDAARALSTKQSTMSVNPKFGPSYPETAAERVALMRNEAGDLVPAPYGATIQSMQTKVAESPRGVSSDWVTLRNQQAEALKGAEATKQAVTGPLREEALTAANFAGREVPILDAGIEKQLRILERTAPPRTMPPDPNALRTAVEIHAPYSPPPLKTGVEKVADTIAVGQRGTAQADLSALRDMKHIIEQQGFAPLKVAEIQGKIAKRMDNPEVYSNDVAKNVLGKVAEKLESLADSNGVIDAHALYRIRKDDIGNFINDAVEKFAKGNTKQAAGIASEVKAYIDDAIEAAGGKGWKSYLSKYSEMEQAIKDVMERELSSRNPIQPTRVPGVHSIASEGVEHIAPSMIDKTVAGAKWVAGMYGRMQQPKVERYFSEIFRDPDKMAAELLRSKSSQRYSQIARALLDKAVGGSAGVASGMQR